MLSAAVPAAVKAAALGGNGLLGEIIAWTFRRSSEWPQTQVASALHGAGLGAHAPRKLAPRFAFMRALKLLQKDGLIRELNTSGTVITFQLTEVRFDHTKKEFVYRCRAMVVMDPVTGAVRSTNAQVANDAAKLFADRLEARTVLDVSRLILGMCQGNADLYPIKAQGGVYFVPAVQVRFCDSVERFVVLLGGRLIRFPVPASGPAATQAVAQVMHESVYDSVAEYESAVAALRGPVTAMNVKAASAAIHQAEAKLVSMRMFVESALTRLGDDMALVKHYAGRLAGENG